MHSIPGRALFVLAIIVCLIVARRWMRDPDS